MSDDSMMEYFDKKFDNMEAKALARHLEGMKYLHQLIIEAFQTRMEVTQLTRRVEALEGKKLNGH
jgi:hypothetical protein